MGGREESEIDYVLVREEDKKEVKSMEVGHNKKSNHHPLIVRLNREKESGIRKRKRKEQRGRGRKGRWDKKGR